MYIFRVIIFRDTFEILMEMQVCNTFLLISKGLNQPNLTILAKIHVQPTFPFHFFRSEETGF